MKKGFLPRSDEELGGREWNIPSHFRPMSYLPRGVPIGIRDGGGCRVHGMTSGYGTFGVSLDDSDVEGWD